MTTTPASSTESSWIDVSSEAGSAIHSPMHTSFAEARQVGLKSVKQQKLLLDAQKDRASEENESDPGSPSPISPNSAIFETSSCSMTDAMLLNRDDLIERSRRISSDWLWDWSVRSDVCMQATAEWKILMQQQQHKKLSLRQWAIRRGFFSKEVLSIFLLSNIVSLILGAGIGYTFLIKRPV